MHFADIDISPLFCVVVAYTVASHQVLQSYVNATILSLTSEQDWALSALRRGSLPQDALGNFTGTWAGTTDGPVYLDPAAANAAVQAIISATAVFRESV